MDRGIVASSFLFSDIVATQVETSAEIAPPALVGDFLTLLDGSFFFDVSGGDGSSVITKSLVFDSYVSTSLTGTTHNLSVSGLNDVVTLYLNPTINLILSGIVAPSPVKRQFLQVVNTGLGSLTFPKENLNSDAENRFIMTGTSSTLAIQQTFLLMYDDLDSRWRVAQMN